MGANCSCSCFGSAMGAEASKVLSESESLWPSFKGRIKQKSKNQSSKAAAFSNYAVQVSPTCLISEKSKALVRIVSISQDGSEFVPVILSPVRKTIPDERQPTKTNTQLGFDAAKFKVKFGDEKISVTESRKLGVCGEEEDQVTVKKSNRRSWVRIAKAFRFLKAPAFHGNGSKVSQNPIRRSNAKETKTPAIKQPKAQEIRQKKKIADSIPGPIEQLSKSSLTSAGVDSSKRQGIKSATLSQLPRPGMNSSTTNFQPKKMNLSAKRKGRITSVGEGYSMAINLSIFIIIMACLVVFSSRLLAVVCTSIWWYLLPGLLKKNRVSGAAGGINTEQWRIR